MIKIKSPEEIKIMQDAGKVASKALKEVLKNVKAGITTLELDQIAHDVIVNNGCEPSFMKVDNYRYTTCININEGIVHGLPNSYKIKSGDLVSIDLGAYLNGFHSDLSYTVEVDTKNETKFLDAGKEALNKAIKQCKVGKHIGDVSYEIQKSIESKGYTVSEMLVGHGVGADLHEAPHVPCYGYKGQGVKMKEGLVIAVEVIYQKGVPDLVEASDGWTIATADGSLSGLFEKTVAITSKGPVLITDF